MFAELDKVLQHVTKKPLAPDWRKAVKGIKLAEHMGFESVEYFHLSAVQARPSEGTTVTCWECKERESRVSDARVFAFSKIHAHGLKAFGR